MPAIVLAFAMGSARANSIPFGIDCNASWRMSANGLCAGGTSGFEAIQMRFIDSEDASDSDVAFTPVNHFASFVPKAQTSSSTAFGEDELGGGAWVEPDPGPQASTSNGNSGNALTNLAPTVTSPHLAASSLADISGSPLNGDPPDPVPEPAESGLAVFGAGLIAVLLRKLQQRRPQAF
jgi:hypothetical protein